MSTAFVRPPRPVVRTPEASVDAWTPVPLDSDSSHPNDSNVAEMQAMLQGFAAKTKIQILQDLESSPAQAQRLHILIEDRELQMKVLAQQTHEVAMLFEQLALLVQEQQWYLDTIETNIEQAVESSKKGKDELDKAYKSVKKRRERTCCFAVTGIGIGAILLTLIPILSLKR